METIGPIVVALWVLSAIAGMAAGSSRGAAGGGFVLGLFLGPLGVVAALGLDFRVQCPTCGGKLDGRGLICQHCDRPIPWKLDRWGNWVIAPEKPDFEELKTLLKSSPPPPSPKEILPKANVTGGWG